MIDLDDLIAALRERAASDSPAHTLMNEAADALEAATREHDSAGDIRRAVRLWRERFIPGDRWDTEDARDLDAALQCVVEANPDRSRARVPVRGEPSDDREALSLWRVMYVDESRDCDGFYPLGPFYVLASHEDDAWNAAGEIPKIDWPPYTGVYEARHATADEAAEWLASRATVPDAATERDEWEYRVEVVTPGQSNAYTVSDMPFTRETRERGALTNPERRRKAGPWVPVDGNEK